MARQQLLHFLLHGVPSDDPIATNFETDARQAAVFSTLLTGAYLCVAGALPAIVFYLGLSLAPSMMIVTAVPATLGVVLLIFCWKVPATWPHWALLSPLGNLVLVLSTAMFCHFTAVAAHNPDCTTFLDEYLIAIQCSMYAWLGYSHILSGYTRLGAAAMLIKPLVLGATIVLSPGFSTRRCWFFVPITFVVVTLCVAISAKFSWLHVKNLRARHDLFVQHQKHYSVVNHVVKNAMADVEAEICLLAEQNYPWYREELFQTMKARIRRGIRWCKNFQSSVKLSQGLFVPTLRPIKLWEFGAELLGGRCATGAFPALTILSDPVLCDLMMENALDNAQKHGSPVNPDMRCAITVTDRLGHTVQDTGSVVIGEQYTVLFQVRRGVGSCKCMILHSFKYIWFHLYSFTYIHSAKVRPYIYLGAGPPVGLRKGSKPPLPPS